ncbi:MAG: zf-TFIIB domain-containing protein [Alphaproteobacteria bacterium]|nr:zf-TFIIB domain-containing protein [Alphaproteobacteria bacterium]
MNVANTLLDCPRCATPMDTVVGRHGLTIDHCGGCGGAWYDAGTFEEAFRVEGPMDLLREGTRKVRTVPCPRCSRGLVELSWPPNSGVRVDTCGDCGGMWLDAGEAARIKRALIHSGRITDVGEVTDAPRTTVSRTTIPFDTNIDELARRIERSGFNLKRAMAGAALMLVTQLSIAGFLQAIRLVSVVGDKEVQPDRALAMAAQLVSIPLAAAVYARVVDTLDARELTAAVLVGALIFAPISPLAIHPLGLLLVMVLGLPLGLLAARLGQPL